MRTLFLVCKPIYPPTGGASLRNWQNINAAASLGPVGVFGVLPESSSGTQGDVVERQALFPRPGLPNGHVLFRKVRSLGRYVHPRRHPRANQYYSSTLEDRLRETIEDFQPDLVIFEELWLYRYLPSVRSTGCPVIFDAHNVEATLRTDMQQASSGRGGWGSRLNAWSVRNIERALVRQSEQVWACSTKDAQEIETLYSPSPDVEVAPNTLDASSYSGVREGRGGDGEAPILLFIGAFGYPPNRRAAHHLLDEIFPRVQRQHPNVRLRLVGGSPSEHMREWGAEQAITVTGFVDDIRSHLAASDIAVIPLMEGSGTRLKIIEAFASKLPVVSTPKGVEGLEVEHGIHALIAEVPDGIASHVSRLIEQPTLRSEMAEEAYELMKQSYSWQSVQGTITGAMQTCVYRHNSQG